MHRSSRNRSTLLAAFTIGATATVLFLSPPAVQTAVRGTVLDLIGPSQAWVLARSESGRHLLIAQIARLRSNAPNTEPSTALAVDVRVAALQQACRRLQVENARLRDELSLAEKYGVSPVPTASHRSFETPTVVLAGVIPRRTPTATAEQLLGAGRRQGLAESDIVIDQSRPHVDQGSDAGLEPELDVLIGRCVVGRIASVGRWASALEPITDPRYRGLAQIVRPSDQGGSFGAEGIVIGQGTDLLKLAEVPTTQSVRVGDEVYTSDRDRRFPIPLYYGRVVNVTEAGRDWDITVRPAVHVSDLKTVAVLKFQRPAGKTLAE